MAEATDRDVEVNSPGPLYATLFVGILDPATRELRYVNAGHHPQYVLRRDGGLGNGMSIPNSWTRPLKAGRRTMSSIPSLKKTYVC